MQFAFLYEIHTTSNIKLSLSKMLAGWVSIIVEKQKEFYFRQTKGKEATLSKNHRRSLTSTPDRSQTK